MIHSADIIAPPADARPTMREIAKALGVSHVTVSLALRASPRLSHETREAVQAMARKMGYRPDPMLSSLLAYRRSRRKSAPPVQAGLAWLNQWDNPADLRAHKEFDGYWKGASEMSRQLGYALTEFAWPFGKSGRRLQQIWETRYVRGVIVPPHMRGIDLPDLDWSRFSVVKLGESVRTLAAHSVGSDQSHCARLAYERAANLGYSRIGYVSTTRFETKTKGHFLEGYLVAQTSDEAKRNKLVPLVLEEDSDAQNEVSDWLRDQKPQGIITSSARLRETLEKLGLRVPQDVGLCATSVLDGNAGAGTYQNSPEIGRVAVSTLAGLILENQCGLPTHQRRVLVQGRWVDGDSLPPCRGIGFRA